MTANQKQWSYIIRRWLAYILGSVILLFVFVVLLLQIPAVQQYVVDRITHFLSSELKTEVHLERVHLAAWDALTLEGMYVSDQAGDTLLYSQFLRADFEIGLWSLLYQELELGEVTLRNAQLHTKRAAGETTDNLQFILDYFVREQKEQKSSNTFRVNLQALHLDQVSYQRSDAYKGEELSIYVPKGMIGVEDLNLVDSEIRIRQIDFIAPVISIRNFEGIKGEEIVSVVASEEVKTVLDSVQNSSGLRLTVADFKIENGQFSLYNERNGGVGQRVEDALNYKDLKVEAIDLDVDSLVFSDDTFWGAIKQLSLKEQSGFELRPSSSREVIVSPTQIAFYGLHLETPETLLRDTLVFEYPAYQYFSNFVNDVELSLVLQNSQVVLHDIMRFAPSLYDDVFFVRNQDRQVALSGWVQGTINNLSGQDLNLRLDGGTLIKGFFDSRNLTEPEQQIFRLDLNILRTNIASLRQIIPNFSLPQNFDKLGNLGYKGKFEILFSDYIIDGQLQSAIGQADLNIKLRDAVGNLRGARYNGTLNLTDFDLAKWTENPDFGKITLSSTVAQGRGLTGSTADALVNANVQAFQFKGYNYQNAKVNGRISQDLFQGKLALKDENIAFDFSGVVDYRAAIPVFDFKASVDRLRLKELNITEQALNIAGNVELNIKSDRLDEMVGQATITQLNIDNEVYEETIDSLDINLAFDEQNQRVLDVSSEMLTVNMYGKFDILNLPNSILKFAHRNFETYARQLNLKEAEGAPDSTQLNCRITIVDAGKFSKFISPKLDTLRDIKIRAHFDELADSIAFRLLIPEARYDSIQIYDTELTADLLKDKGDITLTVNQVKLKNGNELQPILLQNNIKADTIDFVLNYAPRINTFIDQLHIGGKLLNNLDGKTRISFDNTNMILLGTDWSLSKDNYIELGENSVRVNEFELKDENQRRITLDYIGKRGLQLAINGFDLHLIDKVWDYDPLDFSGDFEFKASVQDIFEVNGLSAIVTADSFQVNNDNFGKLRLTANATNLQDVVTTNLNISQSPQELTAIGTYYPPTYEAPKEKKHPPNSFNQTINLRSYPLKMLEYFVGSSISDTEGLVDATLRLSSDGSELNSSGEATVRNGATTIDFLQTRYYIHEQTAIINNNWIKANDVFVQDRFRNKAFVQGGIRHNALKDLRLDVSLNIPKGKEFLVLDTDKGDNDVFYGRGIGYGTVQFTGPFNQTDITARATVTEGSKITIPVSDEREASSKRFITFVNKTSAKDSTIQTATELGGIKLGMDLTLTEEAHVELIFDEQAGDIIRGNGRGNLQITLDRTQEMTMYGDYYIEKGEYLFTLFNFVNKPFVVQRGGRIRWTGDPLNAQINLNAAYKGLNLAPANLIQEYLGFASDDTQNEARKPTDVDLTMKLQGELFKPIISFDIGFPRLQGDLQTYASNKMRTLREDQNELNRQVFGLIVLGQFMPSEFSITTQGQDFGINTVSELITSQLSILLTDLFSDIVNKNKIISGIDFDIAYNRFADDFNLQDGTNFQPYGERYQVLNTTSLLDDKIRISIAPSINSGSSANPVAYGHDIVIESVLNKERTLKFRLYQILEPSFTGSIQQKVGAGISYRKEFDRLNLNFKDWIKSEVNK